MFVGDGIFHCPRRARKGVASSRAYAADVPVAGIAVPTFYYRTSDIGASLGEAFVRDAVIGVGVLVPPPYMEPRWLQVPSVLRRAAAGVDRMAGSWPLVNQLGDHTMSRWVKRRANHG